MTLEFDVEILKVKLDQMDKRMQLLEQSFALMERTHKAEMQSISHTKYLNPVEQTPEGTRMQSVVGSVGDKEQLTEGATTDDILARRAT